MQYSDGKPWIVAIIWIPLDTSHPHKHPCRPSKASMKLAYSEFIALPAGQRSLPQHKNCSGTA